MKVAFSCRRHKMCPVIHNYRTFTKQLKGTYHNIAYDISTALNLIVLSDMCFTRGKPFCYLTLAFLCSRGPILGTSLRGGDRAALPDNQEEKAVRIFWKKKLNLCTQTTFSFYAN